MKLVVDIGNSRVKWAQADGGRLREGPFGFARPARAPATVYAAEWSDLDAPDAVALCSVAGRQATNAFVSWARTRWGVEPREIRASERAGAIVNAYCEPATLGADRWANLLGVRDLLGAVDAVVVDAGTAVTVDALRGDGRHAGGAILAGLAASRSGLRAAAPALPAVAEDGALPADSTPVALGAGTLVGLAGGIERVTALVATGLDRPRWVLTGGDAERLAPWLGEHWVHEPLLTLRGVLAAEEEACAG